MLRKIDNGPAMTAPGAQASESEGETMKTTQLIFKHDTKQTKCDAIRLSLKEVGKYRGEGDMPDGRHYLLGKFEDELDELAFSIGSGFITLAEQPRHAAPQTGGPQ
jgi:hypothetical protein